MSKLTGQPADFQSFNGAAWVGRLILTMRQLDSSEWSMLRHEACGASATRRHGVCARVNSWCRPRVH
jgi:hypothetical protein